MPKLDREKLANLISYCLGKTIPMTDPLRSYLEEQSLQKKLKPLGAFFLRGLDMDGVIAFILPKKVSSDGLDHYLFIWFSKPDMSITEEKAHASLQIKSAMPTRFSLRGTPNEFVRVSAESSMIQSLLVDLIDDLKCLEMFTIYNKEGSQKDAFLEIPPELIGTRFIVQMLVSEEPTKMAGKMERMELALPQLIDLANYSIMTGLKMFGPMKDFSNFCPECGKKLPHGNNAFCIHCGEKLE